LKPSLGLLKINIFEKKNGLGASKSLLKPKPIGSQKKLESRPTLVHDMNFAILRSIPMIFLLKILYFKGFFQEKKLGKKCVFHTQI
jgi:hypothetical protein